MEATSRKDAKARVGDIFPTLELTAVSGHRVTIPGPGGDHVHLQSLATTRSAPTASGRSSSSTPP